MLAAPAVAAPIAEALVSRAGWLPVPDVPVGCCTATVEIFWPSDVVMTTGTCIATRTVLWVRGQAQHTVEMSG